MQRAICVLNHKADLLAYYDSIKECIEMNGWSKNSVYKAANKRLIYKCMLIIYEPEYRKRWEDGTIHELQFGTKKERNHEAGIRLVKSRTPDIERRRKEKLHNYQMYLKENDLPRPIDKAILSIKKPVTCIDTGQTFASVTDAARYLGVQNDAICRAIRKGWKIKGLTFVYRNTHGET